MSEILEIPKYVKNFGSKFLSYILNISDKNSIDLINGSFNLDENRKKILTQFIQFCNGIKEASKNTDGDFQLMYALPRLFHEGRHQFNLDREQLGGKQKIVRSKDKVIKLLTEIALELYPLLLIEAPEKINQFIYSQGLTSSFFELPARKKLIDEMQKDSSINKIFPGAKKVVIKYLSSSSSGGGIDEETFPLTIIHNSYQLMLLKGKNSQDSFIESIKEVINMIRMVFQGKTIDVPLLMGFNNIGLADKKTTNLKWGKIRDYTPEIKNIIFKIVDPFQRNTNKLSGFIFESTYKYTAKFSKGEQGKSEWPNELQQGYERINKFKEDLSLALALAVKRSPPVCTKNIWTLKFDPLGPGTNLSWSQNTETPMPRYVMNLEDIKSLKTWSTKINSINDKNIRLGIRRLLSAINERPNPIDGFIDTIILWENLFGSNSGELGFRISVAISKLLEKKLKSRKDIQRKIKDFYNKRSSIVHGSKEISHNDAVLKRNECLDISLSLLRKLYINHNDLIENKSRGQIIALM